MSRRQCRDKPEGKRRCRNIARRDGLCWGCSGLALDRRLTEITLSYLRLLPAFYCADAFPAMPVEDERAT